MSGLDEIKNAIQKKKALSEYKKQFSQREKNLIEVYNKLEQNGFSIDSKQSENGEKMTRLFKDGSLVVCKSFKSLDNRDCAEYFLLSKDENDKFVMREVTEDERWEQGGHYYYTNYNVHEKDSLESWSISDGSSMFKDNKTVEEVLNLINMYKTSVNEYSKDESAPN